LGALASEGENARRDVVKWLHSAGLYEGRTFRPALSTRLDRHNAQMF
jgi:hypothetical protein